MDGKYKYFDLQQTVINTSEKNDKEIEAIQEKENKTEDDLRDIEEWELAKKEVDSISDETNIENLPIYRNYLAKFDVEHMLEDYELKKGSEIDVSQAEYTLFLRLVFASNVTNYEFVLDDDGNLVELVIIVDETTKITSDKMSVFQFLLLTKSYMVVLLCSEALRKISETERKVIDDERKMKLLIFEKKVKQLQDYKESLSMKSDFDDLLNS